MNLKIHATHRMACVVMIITNADIGIEGGDRLRISLRAMDRALLRIKYRVCVAEGGTKRGGSGGSGAIWDVV
jgi:hypothetical protein